MSTRPAVLSGGENALQSSGANQEGEEGLFSSLNFREEEGTLCPRRLVSLGLQGGNTLLFPKSYIQRGGELACLNPRTERVTSHVHDGPRRGGIPKEYDVWLDPRKRTGCKMCRTRCGENVLFCFLTRYSELQPSDVRNPGVGPSGAQTSVPGFTQSPPELCLAMF